MKDYKIKINGNDYAVSILDTDDKNVKVSVNGSTFDVELENTVSKPKTPKIVQQRAVNSTESMPQVTASAPSRPAPAPAAGAGAALKSPLPGVILEIFVKEGDTVKVGQKLMVLEAMKMENNIECDKEGTVLKVSVGKGSSVLEGDVLITIG